MKTRMKVAAFLSAAMLGCVILWFGKWRVDAPATQQLVETRKPERVEVQPDQTPERPTVVVIEANKEDKLPPLKVPPPPTGVRRPPSAGTYTKYASDDLLMQMKIMAIGDVLPTLGPEPGRARGYVKAIMQTDLTDEEIQKVVDYSKVARESDRVHQAADQKRICSERTKFTSLDEIGAAMNDFKNSAEAHQEELGRNAKAALGAEVIPPKNS